MYKRQAHALLDTARDWLRGQGMTVMRGPLNFTTNHDNPGLLIAGEPSSPVTGMAYNPVWYQDLLESYPGLAKSRDLWAWRITADGIRLPERMVENAKLVFRGESDLSVRPINKKDFRNEVELIRDLYNRCWHENWGFIPMDPDEFYFAGREMKTMVNENLLLIAEWKGTPTPVMTLFGRRGQILGFDLFDNTGGNFNFAVAALSGSGKSVFVNTLATILGDYAANAPMDTFMEARNDRHPTDLAGLRGARFARSWEEAGCIASRVAASGLLLGRRADRHGHGRRLLQPRAGGQGRHIAGVSMPQPTLHRWLPRRKCVFGPAWISFEHKR